jgi:hypothetical protein
MPVCRKCSEDKDQDDFQFHRVSGKYYQTCRRCRQLQSYEWNKNNREKKNASQLKWRKKNPEKEWSFKNPEAAKACGKKAYIKWHEANPNYLKEYAAKNKHKYAAARARRRATQLIATPSWLTQDHKTFIEIQYQMARILEADTGVRYHVDHIHPLKNDNLCGLHVPWNMRVIPALENIAKGNRLTEASATYSVYASQTQFK